MSLEQARAVADAVLYEGYLLYPYRATAGKNQCRWQFGVLGPAGAAETGCGEEPTVASQLVVRPAVGGAAAVTVHLRFLQLQRRTAQRLSDTGGAVDVDELVVAGRSWLSWDEAVAHELTLGPWSIDDLSGGRLERLTVPGGEDVETVIDDVGSAAGRLVRRRSPLQAVLRLRTDSGTRADACRLDVEVENVTGHSAGDKHDAIAASFIGAHLVLELHDGDFVSMTDPPESIAELAAGCRQHRCWPVLAGPDEDTSLMLVSPIILYDHPELAPQSAGALFDSTEIDEILTLRVMTMTDDEKAAARATDPLAAAIIDRCDALTPEALQQMHGVLRDPHALEPDRGAPDTGVPVWHTDDTDRTGNLSGIDGDMPWWDPATDASVSPETDEVIVNGVPVAAGSIVRVHPSRRADAQDLFFAGQIARVCAVHSDVDGATHVAVVLVDDPAADLHDWYGRYLYFAPDELEPLPDARLAAQPSSEDPSS